MILLCVLLYILIGIITSYIFSRLDFDLEYTLKDVIICCLLWPYIITCFMLEASEEIIIFKRKK